MLPVQSTTSASASMLGLDAGDPVVLDEDVAGGQVPDVRVHREDGAALEEDLAHGAAPLLCGCSRQYAASRRTASTTLSTVGMTRPPARRRTAAGRTRRPPGGPARRAVSKPSSATMEATVAPQPPWYGFSSTTSSRLVRSTESSTVRHVQRDQAAQVDDLQLDALGGQVVGGGQRQRHGRGQRHHGDVGARRARPAPGRAVRRGPAARPRPCCANRPLCSKNTTGSSLRIADAIRPTTSAGVDGRHDLQAGHGERPVLHGLRVLGAEAEAAAVGGADHQRHGHLAAGHVPDLGDLVGQVVPAAGEEVGEHDLGDRPHAGHRRAHRGADDRLLGDRGVPDPLGAELLEQPDRRLEDAARGADVLAEADHRRVAAHLAGDALGDAPRGRWSGPPCRTSVRPDVGQRLAGSRRRRGLRRLDAAATTAAARVVGGVDVGLGRRRARAAARGPRAAGRGRSQLLDLLGRPVLRRVGAAVPEVPVGQRLDHGRAVARAGPLRPPAAIASLHRHARRCRR